MYATRDGDERMAGKHYSQSPYRGRRSGSSLLKVLVIFLAVLLAAVLLLYVFLGGRIQYTDDGVRLNLPWMEEPVEDEPELPEVSEFIIEEEPSPIPAPPEEKPLPKVEGVEVSPAEVLAGTAADTVKNAGGNALVVTVKTVEGNLAWNSSSQLAIDAELTGDAAFSEAIGELDGADELYLVARMNCFQDLWMCVHDKSMALKAESGNLWYDTYGMPWLSPANEEARQYLIRLCLELAEMGFDEILLDCGGFPPKGKVSAIARGANYPAEGRDEVVSQWLALLDTALEESGVWLSVRVSESELKQEDGNSGWTARGLAAADRVWLSEGADLEEALSVMESAGMENPAEHLVQIFPEVPEDRSGSWALLD